MQRGAVKAGLDRSGRALNAALASGGYVLHVGYLSILGNCASYICFK